MAFHDISLTFHDTLPHFPPSELHALLLTDVLVLLEKQEDKEKEKEKYFLRTHTVESVSGIKEELSTVIRLKDCLLRTAAADRGGCGCRWVWSAMEVWGKCPFFKSVGVGGGGVA